MTGGGEAPQERRSGFEGPGIAQPLLPGDHHGAERARRDLAALGVRDLRTSIPWSAWVTPAGRGWVDWLLSWLGSEVRLLPSLSPFTPNAGPEQTARFAAWTSELLQHHGAAFEWVELSLAPEGQLGAHRPSPPSSEQLEAILAAARACQEAGKQVALDLVAPDAELFGKLGALGGQRLFDAVQVHAFPLSFPNGHGDAAALLEATRRALSDAGLSPELWLTAGFSTTPCDEARQLAVLESALAAGPSRLYWYALHDLAPEVPGPSGLGVDRREYGFGLRTASDSPKLMFRLWSEGGVEKVLAHAPLLRRPRPSGQGAQPRVLVTGGSGFVGSNLACRLLEEGASVTLLDNLARPSVERNHAWLEARFGQHVALTLADVRDPKVVREAVAEADRVFHLAGQVAVTTSLEAPIHDFEVNAGGTLNLLEAIRAQRSPPPLLFTSTNKVYGGLPDVPLAVRGKRYVPTDEHLAAHGLSEARPLDFHSPYGCSKGAADQYVIDYARTFRLPAVVFRMSCIYGPRQFGNEEQGWVAHFMAQALEDEPITIFGDGRQVRDVLFVDDLVEAFLAAMARIDETAGHAFNVGGGPENALSLLELVDEIEALSGRRPRLYFRGWRPGDQRYYASDTRRLQRAAGWAPRVRVADGLERLAAWLTESLRERLERRSAENSSARHGARPIRQEESA